MTVNTHIFFFGLSIKELALILNIIGQCDVIVSIKELALILNSIGQCDVIVSIKELALRYYTITALERDQCEVLWSRVQQ